jgi:YVTN family beta-propeller protein
MKRAIPVLAVWLAVVACSAPGQGSSGGSTTASTTSALASGRQLTPAGTQVDLGNYPTGGAATVDGKFLWTVSAGFSSNDVRIVDTATHQVCQTLPLPGASGGVALDSVHHLAYVSGLMNSRWQPTKNNLPGVAGDVVHVFSWTGTCGQAAFVRTIAVPPQKNAPTSQSFPAPRSGLTATTTAWPQKLAVSPDGTRLLVALNLANSAAVVDLSAKPSVRYVAVGGYPFGAAILPDNRTGLVSNEAAGTVSVIDLATAKKLADITVGAPLSHPQGIVVDRAGARAYVAISASDQVAVVDLADRKVESTMFVGRTAGLGTQPVAVALSPAGDRLFVANSGSDELVVERVPVGGAKATDTDWTEVGRIPTADQPQAVATSAAAGGTPAQLFYVAAEGMGVASNVNGPNPVLASDPIFWAFDTKAPTTDVFENVGYNAALVVGRAGLMALPSDSDVVAMTPEADKQLLPANPGTAPADTVLKAGGPIKHVFFIVRENRSYDQLLGDVASGNGDPKLTVFGSTVTPNLHSLVSRFPLFDGVLANSEASIQGHYWTAAAEVPDYVSRNWVQQYAGRNHPNDFGTYAVTWPGNGYLFNQAERQGISYFNYGESFMGGFAQVPDRDRTPALLAMQKQVQAKSDVGPPFGGCYAGDQSIGTALDNGEIFDSSMPTGAPKGSYSHVDCFRTRFAQQLASGTVPTLSYLSLTSDHTRGTQPTFPTPTSMVADSDLAIGQLVDTITHSSVWSSSAIFIVEDDSQDGADHVNAHRIPIAVVSPYAKQGTVIHDRYDLLSVVRSVELIAGLEPLTLNDSLATPMYDAFTSSPSNGAPYSVLQPDANLLERNAAAAPDSEWSQTLALGQPDQVPQDQLDAILWHSVHGASSTPPPPGPGASGQDEAEADAAATAGSGPDSDG